MDRTQATDSRWFETKDGEFIGYLGDVFYDTKINPDDMSQMHHINKPQYKSCEWPKVSDLIGDGLIVVKYVYDEYYVRPPKGELTDEIINAVIAEFAENGFNVSREAILHNYEAWRQDFKSGYRDENNGYHLYTACGCNPLGFTATSLEKCCENWQTTYIA